MLFNLFTLTCICPLSLVLSASLTLSPIPIFFTLPFQLEVMVRLFQIIDLPCPVLGSLIDFFSSWRMAHFDRASTRLQNLCLHALIWAIWKEHNNQVFDNLIRDATSVWDSFLFLLAGWARKDCILSNYHFETLRCNLRSIILSHENSLVFLLLIIFLLLLIKKKNAFHPSYLCCSLCYISVQQTPVCSQLSDQEISADIHLYDYFLLLMRFRSGIYLGIYSATTAFIMKVLFVIYLFVFIILTIFCDGAGCHWCEWWCINDTEGTF